MRRTRSLATDSSAEPLITEGVQHAWALLNANLTPAGIQAASETDRNYHCIFGRDASICALPMALADDAGLRNGAAQGLRTLARHQAENGQIPKFVDVDGAQGDFWYVGCIDATLWWLIAVDYVDQHAGIRLRTELQTQIRKALAWLHCQEHPRLHLLQQNEASDWADIMPRSGFVLYSNALWYRVKTRYNFPRAQETRHHFNHLFHPYARDLPEYRRLRLLMHYARHGSVQRDLYLSFVNFSFFGEEGDVLGNLLAVLFGLASNVQANRIVRALQALDIDSPHPMRAVIDPIGRDHPLWRPYMDRHRQNREYHYHNGGAWPFIGGFWVMVLGALGKTRAAQQALARLAHTNAVNHWQFNEWFHGQSGKPMGMPGQSWNAAMLLMAEKSLTQRLF